MPATVVLVVIPEVPPSFAADEFGMRTFANRSTFGQHTLTADQTIAPPVIVNLSTFGAHRLEANALADVNLLQTSFTNSSTFGAHTLAEAPPDGTLRPTVFSNTSTFGAHEIAEAPPDGILRPTVFANVSTFGAHELQNIAGLPDEDLEPTVFTNTSTFGAHALAEAPGAVGIGLIRPKRTGLYKRPGIYRPLVRPRGAVTCFMMADASAYETHELYSGRRSTFNGTGSNLVLNSTAIGLGRPSSSSYFSIQSQQPAICSVEAVITYNSPAGGICGINEGTASTTTYDRWLYINTSGQPVFHIFDTAVKKAIGTALTAGKSYHLCGTSDGSNIRLYVDGQLVATTATSNGGYTAYTNPCFMVQHGHVTPDSSSQFGGSIHFAQFANVAWSDTEVRERATNPYAHAYNGDDWVRAFAFQGS